MTGQNPVFLTVDCGGSGTRAEISDAAGAVIARAHAAASNPHRVGVDAAIKAIHAAVAGSVDQWHAAQDCRQGAARGSLDGIAVGLAGRSHGSARDLVAAALREWSAVPVRVLVDDGELARAAAFGMSSGVLVAAGTGSAAWGRGPAGAHRAGGYGPHFSDEGSGAALGLACLRWAAAQWERREPLPPWIGSVLHGTPGDWARALRDGALKAQDLAPAIVSAAHQGDASAVKLCGEAASQLAELALRCARCCGLDADQAPVATAGSIGLALRPWLQPLLGARLQEHVAELARGGVALIQQARAGSVPPSW